MNNVRSGLLTTLGLLSVLVLTACGDPTATPVPVSPVRTTAAAAITTAPTSTTTVATTAAAPTTNPVTTVAASTTPAIPTPPPSTTSTEAGTATLEPVTSTGSNVPTVKGAFKLKSATNLPLPASQYTLALLAPSGERIAFYNEDRSLCIYSAQGQQPVCATTKISLDPASLRWSPDSRYLTFTENFRLNLLEPDIWLMETATGKLTDLTDDKVSGNALKATGALIDAGPNWSADSKRIFFVRYGAATTKPVPELYSLGIEGGEPTRLGALKTSRDPFATFSLALSPDGQHLAYNLTSQSRQEATDGLWLSNPDGQNATQLYRAAAKSIPGAIVAQTFSPDGRYLLALIDWTGSPYVFNWDESNSRVITLAGGSNAPVDPDRVAQWAGWQPGGTALAYIVGNRSFTPPDKAQTTGIFLVDKPGAPGYQVLAGDFEGPGHDSALPGLTWAANNTMLVARARDHSYILLQFEPQ